MSSLVERDLQHLWHPCSQMKDYETFRPLPIVRAEGSYLYLEDGRRILDAISSWWCKSLGHGHPKIKKAVKDQIERFEHVILANTTNDVIVELSEKLAALMPVLNKVFYASDGSCAVEIAMKMSLHARLLQHKPQKRLFMALENGYHGETALCLSVSDLGIYRDPYKPFLMDSVFITGIPYVSGKADPLWSDCSAVWPSIEAQLNRYAKTCCGILIEPLLQGAGGMKVYSADFLRRLRAWTLEHDVHLIADEIMTGLGRTGLPLAVQHAGVIPDFICLSKSLSSGWLPISCVLTSSEIYELFYDDYAMGKSFLHSHTFTGNALAASAALATLKILTEENIYERAQGLETKLLTAMTIVSEQTGQLNNIRSLGALVAADLKPQANISRVGFAVYQAAVRHGVLLRPLGNTIYWLPPLNLSDASVDELRVVTTLAIEEVCGL